MTKCGNLHDNVSLQGRLSCELALIVDRPLSCASTIKARKTRTIKFFHNSFIRLRLCPMHTAASQPMETWALRV